MATEKRCKLDVSLTEFNTILAALRFWQRCGNTAYEPETDIAENDGDRMGDAEIDEMCERLNCGG